MVLKRHQELSAEIGKTTANNVMRHLRSVYNFAAATHDEFPPNPVQILTQARAWHREQRRQTLVTALDLPSWWKAVMAEPEDVEVDLKREDYREDVFCASGPGGQHVNKTASAIRLTHLETSPLEQLEKLEQLRALDHGISIRVVPVLHHSIGVDTPGDLERVRQFWKEMEQHG